VLLLAIEVFVTPGFGIIGALGVGSLLAGLVLSLLGPGASTGALIGVSSRVLGSLLLAAIAALVVLRFLPRTPFGRRLVLETGMTADAGYVSPPEGDRELLGLRGVVSSPLHPSGLALIDGRRIDVVSEGEYIDAGEPITVIRVDGNRVVVTRQQP